jgi:hypothetical protein
MTVGGEDETEVEKGMADMFLGTVDYQGKALYRNAYFVRFIDERIEGR